MVRVGILGCGSIAKFRHAPETLTNENARLIGFFDPRPERAAEFVKQFGGKAFASAEELLSSSEIDAVCVCSANVFHYEQTMAALAHGKHVLCEKPMAVSVQQAEEMHQQAKKMGKKLMVAENFRLAPAHIKAKKLIESGEIGKVQTFRAVFGHNGPEHWTADKSVNTWFFQKDKCSVGSIGDVGIHKIDAIRWLFDTEVEEVSACVATLEKKNEDGTPINVDDNAVAILKLANGVFGTLQSSWTIKGDEDHSTVIYGSDATMRIYDDPRHAITIVNDKGERSYFDLGAIPTNGDGGQFKTGIIDEFIKCIEEDTRPLISSRDGIEDLRVVESILQAARKKTVIANPYQVD